MMRKLKSSIRRAAFVCIAAVGMVGCARGGDDMYDRLGDHIEWHTLNFWYQASSIHEGIDRYFLNRDRMDPDDYGPLAVPK